LLEQPADAKPGTCPDAGLRFWRWTSKSVWRARPGLRRKRWPRPGDYCLGCLAPLDNGSLVCCDACDELAWKIVPTLSGELGTGGYYVPLV
jgi:hypothetical protein